MYEAVREVRRLLGEQADAGVMESGRRFFKEEVKTYGVRGPQVARLAKSIFKLMGPVSKHDIFAMCDELWESGYMEEGFVACEWAYGLRKLYLPVDFAVFERWVNTHISNWATCDTLCNHSVGAFVSMYPDFVDKLLAWTACDNRWARRAAAVSLIIPARKGLFLAPIFQIAEALLTDKDDLVQKGYGWMLKAASQAHPLEVFDFVMSKKALMPRTAFRYSLEKMPPEWRARAMAK